MVEMLFVWLPGKTLAMMKLFHFPLYIGLKTTFYKFVFACKVLALQNLELPQKLKREKAEKVDIWQPVSDCTLN